MIYETYRNNNAESTAYGKWYAQIGFLSSEG